jgi:hypothetical protein
MANLGAGVRVKAEVVAGVEVGRVGEGERAGREQEACMCGDAVNDTGLPW